MRVGCDIVDLQRFAATIQRRAGMRDRLFTAVEQADARRGGVEPGSAVELQRLAARFAAKEATRKALTNLRLPFHATEVRRGPDGEPHLFLHGAPSDLSVSMSHDAGMAMAVVVGPPVVAPAGPDAVADVDDATGPDPRAHDHGPDPDPDPSLDRQG